MKCKDKAELHEAYAIRIRMCVGTQVDPRNCVRFDGEKTDDGWIFEADPCHYTFALAIVYDDVRKEDRPVFEGDVLYDIHGAQLALESWYPYAFSTDRPNISGWSWNPPKKKTFHLNGEELPLPDGDDKSGYRIGICDVHRWKSWQDAEKVQTAINKLLSGE